MVINPKTVSLFLAFVFISACSTVDTGPSFNATQEIVASRGISKIHWRSGGVEDQKVDQLIQTKLLNTLSSDDAVQIALLNNGNLQSTFESLRIAQADLVAAGLLKNPIFDAEIKFQNAGPGTGFEFAFVQDFIDILYIPLRKSIASAGLENVKLAVAGEILELSAEVKKSFYVQQAAQQTLEMRIQVVKATEASYDLSKRLHAAKNISDLELANERALYEQSKLDLRQAELQVLTSRERLNDLMGLWGSQTSWKIAPNLPVPPVREIGLEGLERKAVERSLDLAAYRQQIEQAGLVLGLARPLALLPGGEFGIASAKELEGEKSIGPIFSIPLPIFNQGQPAVASATAELRSALERYTAQAISLRARVRSAHAAVVAAHDQAVYYKEVLLPLRHRIVKESQLQYNAMQISPTQLILAKQQQIEVGNDYIRALLNYWILKTELELILNGRMPEMASEALSNSARNLGQITKKDH